MTPWDARRSIDRCESEVSTMRVCSEPGCPELMPKAGRCPRHARAREIARGSRRERGYGAQHVATRRDWEPRVATGKVPCWRCGELIDVGEEWDLGHDDSDRTRTRGPEHARRCNRSAAGRAAHGLPPKTSAGGVDRT